MKTSTFEKKLDMVTSWWISIGKPQQEVWRFLIFIFLSYAAIELHNAISSLENDFLEGSVIAASVAVSTYLCSIFLTNAANSKRKADEAIENLQKANLKLEAANMELLEINAELKEVALRDSLTGLYRNRHFLESEMQRMILHAQRHKEKVALLFIDLDNFKSINDTYSHVAGDNVLRTVASLLREAIKRKEDLLGRFGGDEFIAVLIIKKENDVNLIVKKIKDLINKVVLYSGSERIKISASIGVQMLSSEKSMEEQLETASIKMHKEKEATKETV